MWRPISFWSRFSRARQHHPYRKDRQAGYYPAMKYAFVLIFALAAAPPAAAACYAWPLRDDLAYDGDSPRITMPGLPPELARMEIRATGIDTPEIHGHCPAEKDVARAAANRMRDMLSQAVAAGHPVLFCDPV